MVAKLWYETAAEFLYKQIRMNGVHQELVSDIISDYL